MKYPLLCFVLVFSGLAAPPIAAQSQPDFPIQVSSAGEPVGYSYVLVNGKLHAMTDAAGRALISARELARGDTLSARFVGMEGVPFVYDGSTPAGSVIALELTPNKIADVVVSARARDRSRRIFRKYVQNVPIHGWYTGFRGRYDISSGGKRPWMSRGTYIRNHVPGEDVNAMGLETFSLQPESSQVRARDANVLLWQVQRYILLVKGIAERAVQLDGYDSNKGMVMRYRGREEEGGRHIFLIVMPYFDKFTGTGESFQTLIYVNPVSGLVTSSETVSQSRYGIWNVSTDYAVYSTPDRSTRFIHPVRLKGHYEERNPLGEDAISVDVALDSISAFHFTPASVPKE